MSEKEIADVKKIIEETKELLRSVRDNLQYIVAYRPIGILDTKFWSAFFRALGSKRRVKRLEKWLAKYEAGA